MQHQLSVHKSSITVVGEMWRLPAHSPVASAWIAVHAIVLLDLRRLAHECRKYMTSVAGGSTYFYLFDHGSISLSSKDGRAIDETLVELAGA